MSRRVDEHEAWRAARAAALEVIHNCLADEGIEHTVEWWLTLVRIKLPDGEIGIDPSDDVPGTWNVMLYDADHSVTGHEGAASELARAGGVDWPLDEALAAIREHISWARSRRAPTHDRPQRTRHVGPTRRRTMTKPPIPACSPGQEDPPTIAAHCHTPVAESVSEVRSCADLCPTAATAAAARRINR